jgi:trigger factor
MSDQDTALDQAPENVGEEAVNSDLDAAAGGDEAQSLVDELQKTIGVECESIGSLRIKLSVSIPRETLDEHLGREYGQLQREAAIPGFRKGRAPMKLIEKRFSNDVGSELLMKLLTNSYMAAIKKEELEPIGDPMVWVRAPEDRTDDKGVASTVETDRLMTVEKAVDLMKLPETGPMTYACEVELKPKFELPALDGITLTKPKIEVTDQDVTEQIRRINSRRATLVPVEGGPIMEQDLLYTDMVMTVEGREVLREANFDVPARSTWVKGVGLKDFGTAAAGKKVGDTIVAEGEVSADHDDADIRGKKATFSFTVREIKRIHVPPVDQETLDMFAVANEGELLKRIREVLESQAAERTRELLRRQAADHLVKTIAMDVPGDLSQRLTARALTSRAIGLLRDGMSAEDVNRKIDEMRDAQGEAVAHDLKLTFILEKAAETFDIDVAEEELNSAIAEIAYHQNKRFDRVRDELSKENGLLNLYLRLRDDKTLDYIVARAEVKDA